MAKPPSWAVNVAWVAVMLAALATVALTILAWGALARGDLGSTLGETAGAVAFATPGALIVRRAGNVFGWIMLGMAVSQVWDALASVYAVAGIVTFPARPRRPDRYLAEVFILADPPQYGLRDTPSGSR
ncbi:MAG: hypothetical protein ACRDOU_25210 [Streptosporangiaceae bacterium]